MAGKSSDVQIEIQPNFQIQIPFFQTAQIQSKSKNLKSQFWFIKEI